MKQLFLKNIRQILDLWYGSPNFYFNSPSHWLKSYFPSKIKTDFHSNSSFEMFMKD